MGVVYSCLPWTQQPFFLNLKESCGPSFSSNTYFHYSLSKLIRGIIELWSNWNFFTLRHAWKENVQNSNQNQEDFQLAKMNGLL